MATVSAQVPSSGEEDHSLQPSLFQVPAGLMEDHAAATDAAARELAEETGV
ncbi:NUDIX domain-containing protein [Streptomyces virginiae]|uniref:NUDIX domain-containing protein n=1 Tax=Streptomyces virginiae TaxID=1961 RepID=UPI0035DF0AB9